MKIGIVSDSHGHSEQLREAMAIFVARGVDAVIHCGDIADIRDVELLASPRVRGYLVRGNMDKHLDDLATAAEHWGVQYHREAIEVPLGDGEFLVGVHGNIPGQIENLTGDPQFPYICCGHTHETRDERQGITRIINPGSVAGRQPTVAVLDVELDELEFIPLDR